jgi:ligand-binding sensor domain-containing protein
LFGGVVCKEDSIWKHWDFDNSRLLHSVRSLALDSEGNIWAGTYEGLTMFDGTSWQQDTSCPVRSIWRLYFDDNDDYWVGSYVGSYGLSKGLYKKHNNNWTYYKTSTNDLLTDQIIGMMKITQIYPIHIFRILSLIMKEICGYQQSDHIQLMKAHSVH